MGKAAKLYALLGVLVVLCAAAFAVSRHEERKEQIQATGAAILEIPTDGVTNLSWVNDSGSFSFTKAERWSYDDDPAFPVDETKINNLLSLFRSFRAAFSIENPEELSQYGLDDPVCTISVTAQGQTHTLLLGDYSKMDQQRYLSLGDGNVYLAEQDPLEEFDAVLDDLILDDTIPTLGTVQEIAFRGSAQYTILRREDGKSLCPQDVYFTEDGPLDTTLVDNWLTSVQSLSLTEDVNYNADQAALEAYGLDSPELTATVYGEEGSVTLSLSRNPEEVAAYNQALEQEQTLPTVHCYARVDASRIVYEIPQSTYDKLTAVAYNTLRHQKLFPAEFASVTAIDVTLAGERYRLTYTPPEQEDQEGTWRCGDKTFAPYTLRTALCSMAAQEFTADPAQGQEEIRLVLTLDSEDFPTFTLTLYRHNGTTCLATINGTPTAYVTRTQTVDLIEAINQIILDG